MAETSLSHERIPGQRSSARRSNLSSRGYVINSVPDIQARIAGTGLEFKQCNHRHFQLKMKDGKKIVWILNLYPDVHLIKNDPNYMAPFFRIREKWNLMGVIERVLAYYRLSGN